MNDRSATSYTHGHHESVLRSHRVRTAENSASYLLPHLKPGMTVLDVGCGPRRSPSSSPPGWRRDR
ncbi:putative methyltransferase domain protein [Mycobacterium kansasii]|uniref:Putative methyltransferase domain protein n=1 Tax=Mycobacterium kansasii TaxID=1768 RepID=A0A1V3WVQ3_MYCKA|nr:putative methyltransferase domain protein [Mycobacterium kansasii]